MAYAITYPENYEEIHKQLALTKLKNSEEPQIALKSTTKTQKLIPTSTPTEEGEK